MNGQAKVQIRALPTGVPGLDEILGGGMPEYSFSIVAGAPGCGKTTLAHQFMFANATVERPALYFTVLGEPAIKMLRYQQQFSFFDQPKFNTAIRFVNLSQLVLDKDLGAVLSEIIRQVEAFGPSIVVVDSFRTVVRKAQAAQGDMDFQAFLQRLALHLTSWQATTFLIGEYLASEIRDNPVFTVCDGLIWLTQQVEGNSIVRKMQVMKLRGHACVPGLHTFRITGDGLHTFPRTFGLVGPGADRKRRPRVPCGIPVLDKMMGGGLPRGDSLLLAGPSGVGKSVLGAHFIAGGLAKGDRAIVATFEEGAESYVRRATALGIDLAGAEKDGRVAFARLRPLDLSVDEALHEVTTLVKKLDAQWLLIDSLAGFEMALATGFRAEFRESLYRMILALTGVGVTVVSTVEVHEPSSELGLSNFAISFLCDDIIRLRYAEVDGQLRRMLTVVKMRNGKHSHDVREYEITAKGVVIGERLGE